MGADAAEAAAGGVALAVALGAAAVGAATDLRRGVVPNALTAGAALTGLALAAWTGQLGAHALAAVCAVGALLAARALGYALAGRPGLGMGDVKLGGALALLVGWPALWALYLAAVAGALVGSAALATGRVRRGEPVPFAPFIAAGTALALLAVPFGPVWARLAG